LVFHLFGTSFVDLLQGKWAKMEYLTNYWVVSLHFCCNDIYLCKNNIYLEISQIGAVGGEIWWIGSEK
jgi:hypothetical protein